MCEGKLGPGMYCLGNLPALCFPFKSGDDNIISGIISPFNFKEWPYEADEIKAGQTDRCVMSGMYCLGHHKLSAFPPVQL